MSYSRGSNGKIPEPWAVLVAATKSYQGDPDTWRIAGYQLSFGLFAS